MLLKMRTCFTRICVVLFLSISSAYSEVTVVNGGYNLLVGFAQNVPQKAGVEIIEKMKTTLQEGSEVLFNAIGLQFSKVTFEIPESWDVSEWKITVEDSSDSDIVKPDILIDYQSDTVFGKFPFAQQYGGCGVPGYQIVVPKAFFDELNTFPKGISLAREWLKYRYGVFDENGYFGDPLYPLYYNVPGGNPNEVHIPDCVNSEIPYNFTDQDGNECPSNKMLIDKLNSHDCKIHINEENTENVASSLMYFQESLTNMTHICGKEDDYPHNSRSRNKQNVLCFGKSIWDVLSNSSDFKNKETKKELVDIEYTFFKRAKPRVVVAWENTERLATEGKIIVNAIMKLMIDLPDGSKFRAFPFKGDVADDDYPLQDLDDVKTRQAIAVGFKSDFVKKENGNYKTAIEKAVKILQAAAENRKEPPGNIIIITTNTEDLIIIMLKGVCVQPLIDEGFFPEDINELDTMLPCLEVVRMNMSKSAEITYRNLIETIETIFSSKVNDRLTETAVVKYLEENKTLKVYVDEFTETITFSIFGDRQAENFELTLNEEIKKTRKEVIYGNVLQLSYTVTQAGVVGLLYPYKTDPMLVEVQKTSKKGKYISLEIIVHDTTSAEDKYQMPIIIYGICRFGSYPVQNAVLAVNFKGPDGDLKSVILKDDGRGDPDITQNDGVYSRYFVKFNTKGKYTVTLLAAQKEKETRYGQVENAGYKSCCGSNVNKGAPKITQFAKILQPITFISKSGRPEDGYKPSRITDLRVDKITDDGIVLKWTAPGGEADSGMVQSYDIKYFTSPEEAMNNFNSGGELSNITTFLQESGETQELEINYNSFEKNGLYYIAMKARNSKKASDLSTVVEVYIANPKTTDPPGEDKETGGGKIQKGKTSSKTIGLIVGLIVGLLLLMILIYVVIYFVIVKPKRKKQQKDNPVYEPSKKTDSSVLNPINFVSADTLIKHHNEKVKAKTENKEAPIFNEEDFEDRKIQSTNKSSSSSNDQQQEISHRNPRNQQPFRPKSPKRITPV